VEYEDKVTIVTPEGVSLELTLAGLGSRGVGAIVDALIKFALMIATIAFAFGGVGVLDPGTRGDVDPGSTAVLGVAIGILILFVINFIYDVLFETLGSGRTPGKRVAGTRVVLAGGAPVRFLPSAIRNMVRLVDYLPFFYGVGIVSILATSKNQRLGDLAAGTLVVRDPKDPAPRWAAALPQPAPEVAGWDVSAVAPEELSTVRSFLERRYALTEEARGRLAWELSSRLKPRVSGAPENLHPERFLEQLAATKASRG
jgi:uncharacterized RDD family membrane protein YckC